MIFSNFCFYYSTKHREQKHSFFFLKILNIHNISNITNDPSIFQPNWRSVFLPFSCCLAGFLRNCRTNWQSYKGNNHMEGTSSFKLFSWMILWFWVQLIILVEFHFTDRLLLAFSLPNQYLRYLSSKWYKVTIKCVSANFTWHFCVCNFVALILFIYFGMFDCRRCVFLGKF